MTKTKETKMARESVYTTRQKNFAAFIREQLEYFDAFGFTVEWTKSKTWGNCPTIRHRGDKVVSVSGCGYCKHSTALAEALQFLGKDEAEQTKIACMAGTGVNSVMAGLKELGWSLVAISATDSTDTYTIARIK